jgi:ADP-heptose:LPS heptosyltransferase
MTLARAFRKAVPRLQELPVILLGPAEEETLPLFSAEKEVEVIFCPDVARLSTLLQEAFLYVGHDSGITHLAAMLGSPTVALFRHSSVAQWSPLGPMVKVIEASSSGPALVEETLKAAHGFLNARARVW